MTLVRRHLGLRIGQLVLVILAAAAVAAPLIAPYDPVRNDLSVTLQPPSRQHPLGTDQFGRDVLSRLIWGSRISMAVAVSVVLISLGLGSGIGALGGFCGGWIDRTLGAINDILLAFPGFILAVALVAARGSTLDNVILAIAIAYTPRVAVVMRAVVLTIRPRPFIEAARAIGVPTSRIVVRHVLPNSLPPVIVVGTVSAATAVLAEAGLSFLGLGVQPPTATWGSVASDGQGVLQSSPWISASAAVWIAVAVMGLNMLGDGLRDTLDPQLRRQTGVGLRSRML